MNTVPNMRTLTLVSHDKNILTTAMCYFESTSSFAELLEKTQLLAGTIHYLDTHQKIVSTPHIYHYNSQNVVNQPSIISFNKLLTKTQQLSGTIQYLNTPRIYHYNELNSKPIVNNYTKTDITIPELDNFIHSENHADNVVPPMEDIRELGDIEKLWNSYELNDYTSEIRKIL